MELPPYVDAVVFDNDGLLVDTEPGWTRAAPDLYQAACARLKAEPARTVAFEDSRTGATSARSAGTFVVGVPSLPDAGLDADAVFGSLADPALTAWSRHVRESKNAIP